MKDIDPIVHYWVCYNTPRHCNKESPLRRVEAVDGVIIRHGEGDFTLASVEGVHEAD